ncbi:MAG: CpsD/CapB family tyrosine-protein kinase, partial [Candidatus Omnitrophica bacterium]|nr:CpsD/CapB family tyrosine-protein kinase [Candidatus Omnitrophota bacterium]
VKFLYQAVTPWLKFNAGTVLLLLLLIYFLFSKAINFLIKLITMKKLIIRRRQRDSLYLQSYQNLAEQVLVTMKGNEQRSALIVSTLPKEGNSLITANLGFYLAERIGHKVLLIDANTRKPRLHKIFKLKGYFGLVDILKGTLSLSEAVQNLSDKFSVLPCGKTQAGESALLNLAKIQEVVKEAEKSYEFIFIDCANLRNYKDSLVLSSYVDTVITVVNEGQERREAIKAALAPLKERKVNFLGAILNNRTFAIPKVIYERT